MPVDRLTLTDFRSYAAATIEPGPGFVLLSGENGAGKTNLLEAVSLLARPRPARRGTVGMARQGGRGGWAVAARLGDTDHRHRHAGGRAGAASGAGQRRPGVGQFAVSEWLSVLWLTPAMDRLFSGSAGERRRFLDRLVLALEPGHAHHSTRYDAAMRARNKLLAEERRTNPGWPRSKQAMAEHGAAIAEARGADGDGARPSGSTDAPEDEFARAAVALEGWADGDLAARPQRQPRARCGRRPRD